MADFVLTVDRRHMPDWAKKHPLASETGIEMFMLILAADRIWRPLTKRQRALIAELCVPVYAMLLAQGDLTAEQLPQLPALPHRTRESLERKGIVTDGRLTGDAVFAAYWQADLATIATTAQET